MYHSHLDQTQEAFCKECDEYLEPGSAVIFDSGFVFCSEECVVCYGIEDFNLHLVEDEDSEYEEEEWDDFDDDHSYEYYYHEQERYYVC